MASQMQIFADVLNRAIADLEAKKLQVYTFSFYHDHESNALSVCADTEENSKRTVAIINGNNMKHFMRAVREGNLQSASLWQANIGRSLSLGDFVAVNFARTDLANSSISNEFYLNMVQALINVQDRVAQLAPCPSDLVFTCSGPNDEVQYAWALPNSSLNLDSQQQAAASRRLL